MDRIVQPWRDVFNTPRGARLMRLGGGALFGMLLAALVWVAWAQGGTRLDTPMGQALAGSAVAALATALGALPALLVREISERWAAIMFELCAVLPTRIGVRRGRDDRVGLARDPRPTARATSRPLRWA